MTLTNRVYLCYEDFQFIKSNDCAPIKGFVCYRYKNYDAANNAHDTNIYGRNIKDYPCRYAIIPICKWVPQKLDKYILNLKLMKIYWWGRIIVGNGK